MDKRKVLYHLMCEGVGTEVEIVRSKFEGKVLILERTLGGGVVQAAGIDAVQIQDVLADLRGDGWVPAGVEVIS